jgi:hypothetical protein
MSKLNEIKPYLHEIELLSKAKMQLRHWHQILGEANIKFSITTKPTIEFLIQSGSIPDAQGYRELIVGLNFNLETIRDVLVSWQLIKSNWLIFFKFLIYLFNLYWLNFYGVKWFSEQSPRRYVEGKHGSGRNHPISILRI